MHPGRGERAAAVLVVFLPIAAKRQDLAVGVLPGPDDVEALQHPSGQAGPSVAWPRGLRVVSRRLHDLGRGQLSGQLHGHARPASTLSIYTDCCWSILDTGSASNGAGRSETPGAQQQTRPLAG